MSSTSSTASCRGLASPILCRMFNKQDYGFLYLEDSKLSEPVNIALLEFIEDGTVATIHRKWFGEPEDG